MRNAVEIYAWFAVLIGLAVVTRVNRDASKAQKWHSTAATMALVMILWPVFLAWCFWPRKDDAP
jgi:vacuolar-type H+-ATPase subunit I/STV1